MQTKLPRHRLLIALSATALSGMSSLTQAATLSISGHPLLTSPNPLYGTAGGSNNVVNSPGVAPVTASGLNDPTGPVRNVATTPWLSGGLVSATGAYVVDWFYAGSESGFNISFTSAGIGPFAETNLNNNMNGNVANNPGPQAMGTNTTVSFRLDWNDGIPRTLANDQVTPSPDLPSVAAALNGSLVYAWLTPTAPGKFDLTKTVQDCSSVCWFAFALNDNGAKTLTGTDDDHDDFVGFARFTNMDDPEPTPLPAALPLFATGLGALGLIGWRRKRKQIAASERGLALSQ